MKIEQKWKICDCLEGLPEIPDKSVDMILTDLPYGITECSWDNTLILDCLWAQYRRIIKDVGVIVLTASQPFTSILIMSAPDLFKYCWTWEKTRFTGFLNAHKQPLRCTEDIPIFYKKQPKFNPQFIKVPEKFIKRGGVKYEGYGKYEIRQTSNNGVKYPSNLIKFTSVCKTEHPTEKPVELFEYLIKTYTNEGDLVHDSCLGSGTTLEACMNLNRNCIGFEIDPQWEPIYRKRLRLDNTKLDAFNTSAEPK